MCIGEIEVVFKRDVPVDGEQVAAFLQETVKRVKTEEDPAELNELKKLFKKNVPFSLRSYVVASLVRQLIQGGKRGGSCGDGRYGRREKGGRGDEYRRYRNREEASYADRFDRREDKGGASGKIHFRSSIEESAAATVFVSIGRNRRVFPRDLVSLISQVSDIDRDRIGDIRVLDNYSFVQLFAEDADNVISCLDGYEYRGRKLSVSYSRRKDETGAEQPCFQPPAAEPQTDGPEACAADSVPVPSAAPDEKEQHTSE